MSYYARKGDFFGDLWGGITDVVGVAAPILGVVAAPFTGGASLALGATIGAAARGLHGLAGGAGPSTGAAPLFGPLMDVQRQVMSIARRSATAGAQRRVRVPRGGRRRRGRLGTSRQTVVPETAPPVAAVSPLPPPQVLAARLSDLTGGTMTMPGTGEVIPVADPSPIRTYDTIVATVPEFSSGARLQTL